jgi:Holliday junction resolvase RusA-like endonuclease
MTNQKWDHKYPNPITCWIPGKPPTKNKKSPGKSGGFYNEAKNWERTAAEHVRNGLISDESATISAGDFPLYQLRHLVALNAIFYISGRPGDLTNYFKPLCDAMNGVLYVDDRQIKRVTGMMINDPRCFPSDGAGVLITVQWCPKYDAEYFHRHVGVICGFPGGIPGTTTPDPSDKPDGGNL